MPFKINISTKDGKTFKLETEAPALNQHKLGDTVKGEEISPDLAGYELEIKGTSDFAGFTSMAGVEGIGLKKVLLGYGKAMHRRPKGDKKKPRSLSKGLRLRKTVRGETISDAIIQINTKVIKEGTKKLTEIFADQNKTEVPAEEVKPTEAPTEEPKKEEQAPSEAKPEQEPKAEEAKVAEDSEPKTEVKDSNPELEPKESEDSKQEKANPDKEPKA